MKNKLEISTNGVSIREDLEKEHKPDTKEWAWAVIRAMTGLTNNLYIRF